MFGLGCYQTTMQILSPPWIHHSQGRGCFFRRTVRMTSRGVCFFNLSSFDCCPTFRHTMQPTPFCPPVFYFRQKYRSQYFLGSKLYLLPELQKPKLYMVCITRTDSTGFSSPNTFSSHVDCAVVGSCKDSSCIPLHILKCFNSCTCCKREMLLPSGCHTKVLKSPAHPHRGYSTNNGGSHSTVTPSRVTTILLLWQFHSENAQ